MHDEEARAFQRDRLAFFGKVGALLFLVLGGVRLAVLLSRPEARE